jgi:hypothetical protein
MSWFWSLHGIFGKPDMRTDGHAATLDEAKAQFESIWRRWLAWAKLREEPRPRRLAALPVGGSRRRHRGRKQHSRRSPLLPRGGTEVRRTPYISAMTGRASCLEDQEVNSLHLNHITGLGFSFTRRKQNKAMAQQQ